ncbi:hypothetical protein FJTKL_02943 [Diaporthe vaccinii]|uniref:Uncharacterized protein n=1 Tax=Diaporthe vaccinii TaxID=105482 RepID=A0ABR4F378_9PEZI
MIDRHSERHGSRLGPDHCACRLLILPGAHLGGWKDPGTASTAALLCQILLVWPSSYTYDVLVHVTTTAANVPLLPGSSIKPTLTIRPPYFAIPSLLLLLPSLVDACPSTNTPPSQRIDTPTPTPLFDTQPVFLDFAPHRPLIDSLLSQ